MQARGRVCRRVAKEVVRDDRGLNILKGIERGNAAEPQHRQNGVSLTYFVIIGMIELKTDVIVVCVAYT